MFFMRLPAANQSASFLPRRSFLLQAIWCLRVGSLKRGWFPCVRRKTTTGSALYLPRRLNTDNYTIPFWCFFLAFAPLPHVSLSWSAQTRFYYVARPPSQTSSVARARCSLPRSPSLSLPLSQTCSSPRVPFSEPQVFSLLSVVGVHVAPPFSPLPAAVVSDAVCLCVCGCAAFFFWQQNILKKKVKPQNFRRQLTCCVNYIALFQTHRREKRQDISFPGERRRGLGVCKFSQVWTKIKRGGRENQGRREGRGKHEREGGQLCMQWLVCSYCTTLVALSLALSPSLSLGLLPLFFSTSFAQSQRCCFAPARRWLVFVRVAQSRSSGQCVVGSVQVVRSLFPSCCCR